MSDEPTLAGMRAIVMRIAIAGRWTRVPTRRWLPWLTERDKDLVMGQAVCAWWGWNQPG